MVLLCDLVEVVKADNDVSIFLGDEVDLVYSNPNFDFLYDANGYSVYSWLDSIEGDSYDRYFGLDGVNLTYDDIKWNDDGTLTVNYYFVFPQSLSKGSVYDLSVSLRIPNDSFVGVDRYSFVTSSWGSLNFVSDFTYNVQYLNTTDVTNLILNFNNISASNGMIGICSFAVRYDLPDDLDYLINYVTNIQCSEVSSGGLINSIITIVKNIFTSITNLPQDIANSIKGFFDSVVSAVNKVFTAISELPAKIWNLIETGLKNLFVPSEEDIVSMQNDWDMLLRDRFGALYQAVDMITDYADAFVEQEKSTITFPSVTIPLAGANFVFGGWEVKVIPDGFGFLVDALKMVISIVCTFAVVNMLRNRFERILTGGLDV